MHEVINAGTRFDDGKKFFSEIDSDRISYINFSNLITITVDSTNLQNANREQNEGEASAPHTYTLYPNLPRTDEELRNTSFLG